LGHFEVKGAKHDSGQLIKNGVATEDLCPEDSWVLGHLHRHQHLAKNVYYTGTTLQYNFGEPLPKGFTVSDITLDSQTQVDTAGVTTIPFNITHKYITLDTPYILENVFIYDQSDFDKLHFNDKKYFYKIFIEGANVVVPQKLLNGSINNIYKIIYTKSSLNKNTEAGDQSLSEAFYEDADKTKLFEPLGGLEDYLVKEALTQEQIQETLDQIASFLLEFNPKRD
jgi:DNA repair exonuclease SbcCD nuclease subunit